jgi:hypothetical protein
MRTRHGGSALAPDTRSSASGALVDAAPATARRDSPAGRTRRPFDDRLRRPCSSGSKPLVYLSRSLLASRALSPYNSDRSDCCNRICLAGETAALDATAATSTAKRKPPPRINLLPKIPSTTPGSCGEAGGVLGSGAQL